MHSIYHAAFVYCGFRDKEHYLDTMWYEKNRLCRTYLSSLKTYFEVRKNEQKLIAESLNVYHIEIQAPEARLLLEQMYKKLIGT